MKKDKKVYWKGLEQLTNDPNFVKNNQNEFPDFLPISGENGPSRRDFLKLMGFGIAAVSLAACEAPVRKAIPYAVKPVEVDPGIPNYYASTYQINGDYCPIVVKTREGRPIKIDGNSLSPITLGGTSAQVQASILSLYDSARLDGPRKNGERTDWETIDKEIRDALSKASNIRIVSNTILSPTTKKVIEDFKGKYSSTQHIMYDPTSYYGMIKANEQSFGQKAIPSYNFDKADVIVSFEADFLGTWLSPVEFSKQYSKTRKLQDGKKNMSRHYQFESLMTLTGANADYRTPIKPSQEGQILQSLHAMITGGSAKAEFPNLARCANDLKKARGKSIVVSGSNDPNIQTLVNAINQSLGNYGNTLDINTPVYYRQGDDEAMADFISSVENGSVDAVIFYNCNPVYNHPLGAKLVKALEKAKLTVTTSDRVDETAALVTYIAPDHHFLESWNDAMPKKGHYSFQQPTITRIFNTRQAQESFLTWADAPEKDYYKYLQDNWKSGNLGAVAGGSGFQKAWDTLLMDGVTNPNKNINKNQITGSDNLISEDYQVIDSAGNVTITTNFSGNIDQAISGINKTYSTKDGNLELKLYEKVAIGDGTHANNPWLHETPDPITKATWDNYLTISQSYAKELGLEMSEGHTRKGRLTVGDISVDVPVMVQPGQAYGTIGIALGYGRKSAGLVADNLGVDANPFVQLVNKIRKYTVSTVNFELLDENYTIAQTQTQNTYMGRETVIQEATLPEYQEDPSAGRYHPKVATWKDDAGKVHPGTLSLWSGHKYDNHHWGLMIDLNSCTGCNACTVSCHLENNVPVVGRDEVIMRRDMHWLRIDRYYSSDASPDDNRGLEIAAENPQVTFQPMLCQHCNNAPCETVCPVAATTHSTEGLNQMTYNRCIGTRYCANNCPYKVRRFNWFKYHDNDDFAVNYQMNTDLGKMVLNPDVTVRSRGVMEKCSFCVQRIQAGKLEAKKEGRRPQDGDIVTACAAACPTDAIVFGDMNDPSSRISKMLKIKDTEADYIITKELGEPRAYHVLEEIGTKPNVTYLTKIRNIDIEEA